MAEHGESHRKKDKTMGLNIGLKYCGCEVIAPLMIKLARKHVLPVGRPGRPVA